MGLDPGAGEQGCFRKGFLGPAMRFLHVVQTWSDNEKTPGGRNRSEHSSLGRVFLSLLQCPCERSLEQDHGMSWLPASRTDLTYRMTEKALWGLEQILLAPKGVTWTSKSHGR